MNTPTLPTDELFEMELRIAQRADELVREFGTDPEHALEPWRQAEREYWRNEGERLKPSAQPECA
ncbi:MAG TPA: hypothetical protein VHE61_16425 [Opitutaceae bacterium]|nr:hypothetical protein [Opitutaceae bacterium]